MRIKQLIILALIGSAPIGLFFVAVFQANIRDYYFGYCTDQAKYLSNDDLVASMIAEIIKNGDYGRHRYSNKDDYKADIKECCEASRQLVFMEYGKYMGYIVSISKSYRNYKSDRYSFIKSYFDECGKKVWKSLAGG